MSEKLVKEIFDKDAAESYDERNKRLLPISENLHFLIQLVLKDLPDNAKLLCVGVGTGIEIEKLALQNPTWSFVGVDPSAAMLEGCKARLERQGLIDRCELFHGYLSELPHRQTFNASLCLLVAHFIKDLGERKALFADIGRRLEKNGYLINAEISYDTSTSEYKDIMEKWKLIQQLSGASEEQLANMEAMMKEYLLLLPPHETEGLIESAGFYKPIQFFQSLLIHGWYSRKH